MGVLAAAPHSSPILGHALFKRGTCGARLKASGNRLRSARMQAPDAGPSAGTFAGMPAAAAGRQAASFSPDTTTARSSPALPASCATARLVLVGDVHGQWSRDDEVALAYLQPDCAVFVGDFNEEDVPLVSLVARCPGPKAVILGNHDAWFSLTTAGRQRYARSVGAALEAVAAGASHVGGPSGRVRQQLEALGEAHVGYGEMCLPAAGVSIVGARPFSKGGDSWPDVRSFYTDLYGVSSLAQSARRVADAILRQPADQGVVVVGHNGPLGLGSNHHSICGVDFRPEGGDHGDEDLRLALELSWQEGGRPAALVAFGHMHEQLKHGGDGSRTRNMVQVDPERGTVYLNCAVVPRIRDDTWLESVTTGRASPGRQQQQQHSHHQQQQPQRQHSHAGVSGSGRGNGGGGGVGVGTKRQRTLYRHFCVVEVLREGGHVVRASNAWVHVPPQAQAAEAAAAAPPAAKRAVSGNGGMDNSNRSAGRGSDGCRVVHEQVLLKRVVSDCPTQLVRTIYQGHSQRWLEVSSPLHPRPAHAKQDGTATEAEPQDVTMAEAEPQNGIAAQAADANKQTNIITP